MYANTYCVNNVHNSTLEGRGWGGGCLRGLDYYFPQFQHFPYLKRCPNYSRSKIEYQKHVECSNVITHYFLQKRFSDNFQNIS